MPVPTNWDSMVEFMRADPGNLGALRRMYGSTRSSELAGAMLGALTQVRREGPLPSAEVNSAIFGLVETMPIWEMEPWMPEGMLNTLDAAISEDGVPSGAKRGAVAALLERAASQSEQTLGRPVEALQISFINVCASLTTREEMDSVLSSRPGSREAMTAGVERILARFREKPDLLRLYSEEIEYVLDALRHEGPP